MDTRTIDERGTRDSQEPCSQGSLNLSANAQLWHYSVQLHALLSQNEATEEELQSARAQAKGIIEILDGLWRQSKQSLLDSSGNDRNNNF